MCHGPDRGQIKLTGKVEIRRADQIFRDVTFQHQKNVFLPAETETSTSTKVREFEPFQIVSPFQEFNFVFQICTSVRENNPIHHGVTVKFRNNSQNRNFQTSYLNPRTFQNDVQSSIREYVDLDVVTIVLEKSKVVDEIILEDTSTNFGLDVT